MLSAKEILVKNLDTLLAARGINKSEFARRLGVQINTVQKWFSAINAPNLDQLDNIAKELGVTVGELLTDKLTPKKKSITLAEAIAVINQHAGFQPPKKSNKDK